MTGGERVVQGKGFIDCVGFSGKCFKGSLHFFPQAIIEIHGRVARVWLIFKVGGVFNEWRGISKWKK